MDQASYYCDKYHREKNEPATEWETENNKLLKQWYAAKSPEKYGCQLSLNFEYDY